MLVAGVAAAVGDSVQDYPGVAIAAVVETEAGVAADAGMAEAEAKRYDQE